MSIKDEVLKEMNDKHILGGWEIGDYIDKQEIFIDLTLQKVGKVIDQEIDYLIESCSGQLKYQKDRAKHLNCRHSKLVLKFFKEEIKKELGIK